MTIKTKVRTLHDPPELPELKAALDERNRLLGKSPECSEGEHADCDNDQCSCRCHWIHELMPEEEYPGKQEFSE